MGIEVNFIDDIDLVLQALENGDIEDAKKLLLEIKEEQQNPIKPLYLN